MSKNALNQRKRLHRKPAPVEKARVQVVQEPTVSKVEALHSLTDAQVANLRRILAISVGPYALVCSREDIERLKDMMQEQINTVAEELSQ